MSKAECYECHKTGHYARDCRSKGKAGSERQRDAEVAKIIIMDAKVPCETRIHRRAQKT
jgi:hypothetical protein